MEKKKWVKKRHKVAWRVFFLPFYLLTELKYRIRIERFRPGKKEPFLYLINHQTEFDQFFLALAVRNPIYFVASEDIFSNGLTSTLIKYLVAPIPIKKQMTDVRAVKNCLTVAKEGGSVMIAPEGNRTYAGRTVNINPAIAPLARKLNLPIAFFIIEGGYGVQPRWSNVVRRGHIRAGVKKVIRPEEYANMTNEELYAVIKSNLYVNEAKDDFEYKHSRRAEFLDRVMYVCPNCGLTTYLSNKNIIECQKCHQKIEYLPNTTLKGVDGDFKFTYTADWYDWQEQYVNTINPTEYIEKPLYEEKVKLIKVVLYKRKEVIDKNATVRLFGDRMEFALSDGGSMTMAFSDIAGASVVGRNKGNFYTKDTLYQIKADNHFNALKYINLYYRYTHVEKGETNEQFLGL